MAARKLTLLHSNDMHGDFLAEKTDEKLIGGISLLSGYIKKVRSEEKNVIYAIAGDMFKGSIIDSEFKGLSTIELMNIIGPDVATLGNHEIDYGLTHLLFLEKCARFPIINANLFITSNHSRIFTPYTILERGGLNIMFIGVITDEVLAQTKSEKLIGTFIDVREAAREIGVICDTYRTTAVDITVILTHIGIEKDRELAVLLDKQLNIDFIIGGHSHTFMQAPEVVNGIPIMQVGTGTDQIGRLDIKYERDGEKRIGYEWSCIPIDSGHCPNDEAMDEVLTRYKSTTDAKYMHIITTFARRLTHPSRIQETELGNLFADMLQVDSSFDLMILGSGSIRVKELGPIVQYQDLKEAMPYDDPLFMLEVTGKQLREMLRFILREDAYSGHTEFYQYSQGLRIVYSRGKRDFTELKFHGRDIEDGDRIKIALQQYHYNNFDSFFGVPLDEVTKNRKPRMVATSCTYIFEEYLATITQLDARVEGRLVVTE